MRLKRICSNEYFFQPKLSSLTFEGMNHPECKPEGMKGPLWRYHVKQKFWAQFFLTKLDNEGRF